MRLLFLISLLIFSTKSPCAPFKGQAILAEKPILLDPQVRFFKTPGTVDFYFASYSHIKNEDESPQDLCLDFCAEEESAALDLFDKPQKHINHSTSKEINKLIAFLKKRIKTSLLKIPQPPLELGLNFQIQQFICGFFLQKTPSQHSQQHPLQKRNVDQ